MGNSRLRFDDSLETVLAGDISSSFGMQSAWRQLVDLIGRRRAPASDMALERLRLIRGQVPPPVRAASARALAFTDPPAALVRLFAEDELTIAAPVLRIARLSPDEWVAMLPLMPSANRSILRHRRDLDPIVTQALEAFGPSDFVLPPAELSPLPDLPIDPAPLPPPTQREDRVADDAVAPAPAPEAAPPAAGAFRIADIVARIDAFQRDRDAPEGVPASIAARAPLPPETFLFETDAAGIVRWVAGIARGPLIGLALDGTSAAPGAQVDGMASGAFRRRASFANARLLVPGESDAAGQWRISGVAVFEPATGRFTGYRGSGRRPRPDERADPVHDGHSPGADSVRQLVHELRTPTTAIAGFAEMIEGEMLGPVGGAYRDYAATIRQETRDLLVAIEDLDTAARLDSGALQLRAEAVAVQPLVARIIADLQALATLRGARIASLIEPGLAIDGDERAAERLIARLLSVAVASAGQDETVMVTAGTQPGNRVILTVDRPRALGVHDDNALMTLDMTEEGAGVDLADGSLLGIGFTLRLVRNLAREMNGSLSIGQDCLTLRLPAVVSRDVGQRSTN